jgi:hypothetical protein
VESEMGIDRMPPTQQHTRLRCLECGRLLPLKHQQRTVRRHFERLHPFPDHPAAELIRGRRSALFHAWLTLQRRNKPIMVVDFTYDEAPDAG